MKKPSIAIASGSKWIRNSDNVGVFVLAAGPTHGSKDEVVFLKDENGLLDFFEKDDFFCLFSPMKASAEENSDWFQAPLSIPTPWIDVFAASMGVAIPVAQRRLRTVISSAPTCEGDKLPRPGFTFLPAASTPDWAQNLANRIGCTLEFADGEIRRAIEALPVKYREACAA